MAKPRPMRWYVVATNHAATGPAICAEEPYGPMDSEAAAAAVRDRMLGCGAGPNRSLHVMRLFADACGRAVGWAHRPACRSPANA